MRQSHKKVFLYEEISQSIEERILQQTYQIGQKLPSVRMLCKQYGVSPSTIFQAYYRLEAKGLIEARPKSGYYVRYHPLGKRKTKAAKTSTLSVYDVNVKRILDEMDTISSSDTILRLSMAIPDLNLLPAAKLNKSAVEAFRIHREELLGYAPVQGNLALRENISRHLLNWGGNFYPEEILITNGCIDAINSCLKATCKAGDVVVTDDLTYFGIHQALENLGLKVVPIPHRGSTGICLDDLEQAFQKFDVKACVLVINFHNPTGSYMSDEGKKRIYELISKYQIPLIEDDVYGELYFGKKRPGNVKQYDQEGLVLYCSSFSKTLSPGYRIGYCLPGKYLQETIRQKRIHSYAVNTLSQAALTHFLDTGRYEYHLRKLRNELHKQLLIYTTWIANYFPNEVCFIPPEGGLVFWLEFPEGFDGYQLFLKARDAHLGIAPGQIFSVTGKYQNYIRLSFAHIPNERLEEGFRQLGKLAAQMLS